MRKHQVLEASGGDMKMVRIHMTSDEMKTAEKIGSSYFWSFLMVSQRNHGRTAEFLCVAQVESEKSYMNQANITGCIAFLKVDTLSSELSCKFGMVIAIFHSSGFQQACFISFVQEAM